MSMKIKLFSFFVLFCVISRAQVVSLKQLEQQVTKNNDALQYDQSIQLLCDFISNDRTTAFEKYTAYLYKAHTYKRLFNYESTIENLDLAFSEGIKSDQKQLVTNTIKAQKAFCYFDQHFYDKASLLMKDLEKSNYAKLDDEDKSFIIMQEGYLAFLNKDFKTAENKLNLSIAVAQNNSNVRRNLPNMYGKKIELYNAMNRFDKRDEAFRIGIKIAKEYKIIKYEMYLYEVLRNVLQKNNDYKNAFEIQKKYDSIAFLYNASNHNGKIAVLEKKIENDKQKLEEKNRLYLDIFLIILISILVLLLIISVRLYFIGKERRALLQAENKRIHDEIERLTKQIDEQGNSTFDFSKFDLTERQLEIIQFIKEGKSNKEIAALLFISENTVKYHLKIIYEILNIDHRSELTK